jgi:hypothetical protein
MRAVFWSRVWYRVKQYGVDCDCGGGSCDVFVGGKTMRRGVGDYFKAANYNWMFFPPPYRFLAATKGPGGVTPDYASARSMGLTTRALSGLGCGSGGCSCHGKCGGMGQVDLSSIGDTLQGPVTLFGFTFPLWVGLAGGIAAVALIKNMSDGGGKRRR